MGIYTAFYLGHDVAHTFERDHMEVYRFDSDSQHIYYYQVCGEVYRRRCTEYCLTKTLKTEDGVGQVNHEENQWFPQRRRSLSDEDNDIVVRLII